MTRQVWAQRVFFVFTAFIDFVHLIPEKRNANQAISCRVTAFSSTVLPVYSVTFVSVE